jgi:hypothetical protein
MSFRQSSCRAAIVAAVLLCGAGSVRPVVAQKTAPLITRDTDHDGVPDPRDRCRGTPVGATVDANGCPSASAAPPSAAPAPQASAPAPQSVAPGTTPQNTTRPGTQAASPPASSPPASSPPAAPASVLTQALGNAGATPANTPSSPSSAPSTPANTPAQPRPASPQPAAPVPSVPAPPASSLTAGFAMPLSHGTNSAAQLEYARTLVLRLDSAIVSLVEVFRGTSGVPLAGASEPTVLSTREKGRWTRCRLLHLDLLTMKDAVEFLKDSAPGGATVSRAATVLSSAFAELSATEECDNVGSMIAAPLRWQPWQTSYENAARAFYRDWYTQLRNVHEANRGFARALIPVLPATRVFDVPPGLPRTPPMAGAAR